jgi:hypothetical protein
LGWDVLPEDSNGPLEAFCDCLLDCLSERQRKAQLEESVEDEVPPDGLGPDRRREGVDAQRRQAARRWEDGGLRLKLIWHREEWSLLGRR